MRPTVKRKSSLRKGHPTWLRRSTRKKITINAAYKEIQNTEKKIERDKRMKEAAENYKEDESLTIVCSDFYPWCLRISKTTAWTLF